MKTLNFRKVAAFYTLGVFILLATITTGVWAQSPAVDSAATQILKRMTDYLGSLKKFSVNTQNTIQDFHDWRHRIDFDVSATVTVSRPNKLHALRRGELIDQDFYYDGKTLTLYNPSDKVYATEPAPETFEELFVFMYESLGFLVPVSDLVYSDAYPLLMQEVTDAVVLGKTFIDGVKCDHLLFSRPGVDFQVWVADGSRPLPRKYVVTDTGNPLWLSISTVMSDWNIAPAVDDARFTFVPPQGTKQISFMSF